MSEAGNINQSVMSDEDGVALAQWHTGGRSPVDVEPYIWSVPFIDANGNGRCDPEEAIIPTGQDLTGSYVGGCGGAIYEANKELFYPEQTGELPIKVNPRDGLVRIVGFTQGEARFIDLGEDLESDDGLYNPNQDLVPLIANLTWMPMTIRYSTKVKKSIKMLTAMEFGTPMFLVVMKKK